SGSSISPITPPPSKRNSATLCSSVETSASPAITSTGIVSFFTSSPHAIGCFSSAISFSTSAGKPSGFGASSRYSERLLAKRCRPRGRFAAPAKSQRLRKLLQLLRGLSPSLVEAHLLVLLAVLGRPMQ